MATRKYGISAQPYASVYGDIEIPEEVTAQGTLAIKEYIDEHFDDIDFGKPDIDYCGTDYDIYDDETGMPL